IYLHAETGKITALLGRNGSGKSSLFRCAFSDLEPQKTFLSGSMVKN
ncbi:MAG: ATP-binding cassette domain-containing protein, partial [Saprospiraceae bacterium]|nr:ATP-binding cassette domain-containing protein [Candidatus Brachybacter algidus]